MSKLSDLQMMMEVRDAIQEDRECLDHLQVSIWNTVSEIGLTLVLLNPDIPCICKQCSSRSVGF